MKLVFKAVFIILLDLSIFGSISTLRFGKNLKNRRYIVGGKEAARPPVDDPAVYVFKEDHFAKVHGSRQGLYPNSYYSFVGLRYAEPPVGKYRFQRSKKIKLEGDVTGIKYGPPCLQPNPDFPNRVIGSEDCLFLNVHTPRLQDFGAALPVIFWIHGGGYRRGSAAQYGGGYLTRRDVIVVTVQYRLGTLGFLSTNDKELPGNVAMFDLAIALDWVKNYIEFFGGDPNNIVPMGQGSGGSSAVFMGLSNVTQGRTKRMIAMSGSPLSPFAIDENPKDKSKILAEKTGCPTDSTFEMVRCLKQISPEKLIMAESELEEEEIKVKGIEGLGTVLTPAPVIEDQNDLRFLPSYLEEEPRQSFDFNRVPKIPLLIGVTKHETAGAVSGSLKNDILGKLKNIPDFVNNVLLPNLIEKNKKRFYSLTSLAKNPLKVFTGNYFSTAAKKLQDNLHQVIEATSDALFNFPAYLTSSAWSKQNVPTFFYSFDHIGKLKGVRQLLRGSLLINQEEDEENAAATHGSDLPYIFDLRSLDGNPFSFQNESSSLDSDDEKVRKNMLDLITNFVKSSGDMVIQLQENKASGFPNFISILPESTLGEHFRQCQMSLWSGISVKKPCSPLSFIIDPFKKGIDKTSEFFSNASLSVGKKPEFPNLPGTTSLGRKPEAPNLSGSLSLSRRPEAPNLPGLLGKVVKNKKAPE